MEEVMIQAECPQKAPYKTEVKAGKRYFWCSCGKSANQPFCDGAHKDTDFEPMVYEAEKDGDVYFCGCKATGRGPMCDGSHNKL
jgi:CDGSH-type Zn-finger protein